MRITCPECAAEYDVATALAPGRVVRCARCSTQWAPVPAAPEPQAEPSPGPVTQPEPAPSPQISPEPEPTPATVSAAPAAALAGHDFLTPPAANSPRPVLSRRPPVRRPGGRAALALAWVSSAVLLVMILAALTVFRAPVMRAWPPSTRAYAALGLA